MVFISRPISDYVKMLQKENIEPTLSTAYEQDMSSVFQKDLEYCCTPVSKNEKRPLRSIVLQIISKRLPRGSGKTQSWDTEVAVFLAGEVQIKSLAELFSLHEQGIKFDVISMSSSFQIERKPCQILKSGVKKEFIVKTRSGNETKCSAEHQFVVMTRKKKLHAYPDDKTVRGKRTRTKYSDMFDYIISVKKLSELTPDFDYLPVASIFPVEKTLKVLDYISKDASFKIPLTWNFGFFIGAWLADGSGVNRQVSITKKDNKFLQHYRHGIDEIFSVFGKSTINTYTKANCIDIRFSSQFGLFLQHEFERKAIPAWVFNANPLFQQGLISGLLSGDGEFGYKEKRNKMLYIELTQKRHYLIKSVSLLLRSFGISHSIRARPVKNFGVYLRMYIYRESIEKFLSLFKIVHSEKEKVISNATQDMKTLKMRPHVNEVLFDKIVSIKPTGKNVLMFDLVVADNETFMLANGLITHNSTIGLAIAYQIFKLNHVSFTIKNNLHFSVDNLGAAVADKIPAGTTEILDEVRQSERFGIGSNYSSARLGDIANISRAYGLNIIVISASEMLGMFGYKPDYYLSADSIEFETDKNMAVIYDSDEYQPRGFVTIKKPQEKAFANMEEEYIKAKMRFISQNLVGEMRDKIKLIDEKVQRLVANDDFIFCINDKERRNVFQETFGTNIPIEVMNQIISKAVFNLRKQGQLDMRNKPVGEKKIKKV